MVFGRSSKVRQGDDEAESAPHQEAAEDTADNVLYSILVGVALELDCKFPDNDAQSVNARKASVALSIARGVSGTWREQGGIVNTLGGASGSLKPIKEKEAGSRADPPAMTTGTFAITGPPEVVAQLEKMGIGKDRCAIGAAREWCLSPTHPVTLEPDHRKSAGVPMRAVSFCYIHPIPSLKLALESLQFARNEWAFVLLLGGFAYFCSDGTLLAVNAVSLASSNSGLALVGQPVTPGQSQKVLAELTTQGRLIPAPADWLKGGFKATAWVHPSEVIAGELITTVDSSQNYNHGAFLFECKHDTLLYSLVPVSGAVLRKYQKRGAIAIQESNQQNQKPPSHMASLQSLATAIRTLPSRKKSLQSLHVGMLGSVMADMKEISAAAERTKQEASKLAEVVHRAKVEEPFSSKFKKMIMKMAFVALYIGLGTVCFMAIESDWSSTDAAYFSVATLSTVGYGDLILNSSRSRGFTAIYMLFGGPCFFWFIGILYESSIGWCREVVAGLAKRVYGRIFGGSSSTSTELPSAFMHYLGLLAPQLVVGMGMNIFLSAYIFTVTSKAGNGTALDYNDALWHCWVTATTVGYGDIYLESEESKIWATFHILLAVSWLSSLLGNISKAIRTRGWALQREKTRNIQKSRNLIAALDLTGNGRVTKLDFVVGMIIALGAEVCGAELEYETHVKPLIARFDRLDEDADGYLEMDDLAFLVQSSRKENKEETEKWQQNEKHEKQMMQSVLRGWSSDSKDSEAHEHWEKATKSIIHVEESLDSNGPPKKKSASWRRFFGRKDDTIGRKKKTVSWWSRSSKASSKLDRVTSTARLARRLSRPKEEVPNARMDAASNADTANSPM